MKSAKSFLYRLAVRKIAKDFDAGFYLSHYEDLSSMKSKDQALKHFVEHGKHEGRFPNEAAYLEYVHHHSDLYGKFDPVAYKFFNKDLAASFDSDAALFRHYVMHGQKEGRACSFEQEDAPTAVIRREDKWQIVFSTSQFLSWCGDEISDVNISREEALELFQSEGIEKLWPISFEYAFDVDFVRENGTMPGHARKSDADLYRLWLNEGFTAGVAPNERVFLNSYLGGLPFPQFFDWKTFSQRSGLSPSLSRSQALVALFNEPPRKIIRNIDLMGQDAAWLLDAIGRRALVHGDPRKALAMFGQSVAIRPGAEPLCLLGDAYRNIGETQDALKAYLSSIETGTGTLWAFLHAATIYADRKEFARAFDIMRKAHPKWRHKAEFNSKVQELVQQFFEHQSARAHTLYREFAEQNSVVEDRHSVDALLTDTLNEIRAVYTELDSLPPSMGGDPQGYIAILANDDLRQCTHYRIEQKLLQFANAEIPVKFFSHSDVQGFMDSLVGARAAIFYRVAAVPKVVRAILHATSLGLDTYYEIDDLIFDTSYYPDPFPSFEGQISAIEYAGLQFGVPLFRYAMSMCKSSIASTAALAERMRTVTLTDTSLVVRNGLDERNEAAITIGANRIQRQDSGRVRIFYGSGTKAHNSDFNTLVGPALLDLMQSHPHVDLVIVGHLKLTPDFDALAERIITYPFISDVNAYWSILASCDINLAVLEHSVVADCKSEIKWLEAAVLQIPSIVSGTKTYHDVIDDGINGFIVDTPSQWHAALRELIDSASLREQVGLRARQKALREYNVDVAADALSAAFDAPRRPSMPLHNTAPRILICNVFFSPQSHGGATRVVEDNVWTFQERFPNLEIGVFCSDEGASPEGRLSIGSERGVPVYRLTTPQEVNMDWRPFNDASTEPFERVLDHFQPDLIHFHCIQRLTATIAEVALRRDIPYVVTLHDAWWISDYQFLVDDDGLLQLPTTDVLADCEDGQDRLQSIARRQRLTSLLQNAQATLAVSESFADIYANAGITNLRVVENGTPQLAPVARPQRADGRISLGHIGGRSAHKGASLIEATLRRGNYKNLHLTMIDGTMSAGQVVETNWGTTPVTLMAPLPQAEVAKLYGQLDVLLAPSTWPESFGLVTREALSSGLWVVASSLGAIGQNVQEGQNGYVIDTMTTRDLGRVLTTIDADPERYRNLPPVTVGAVRTMADQAADLNELYQEIVATSPVSLPTMRSVVPGKSLKPHRRG